MKELRIRSGREEKKLCLASIQVLTFVRGRAAIRRRCGGVQVGGKTLPALTGIDDAKG
jgi:hypothetical protein